MLADILEIQLIEGYSALACTRRWAVLTCTLVGPGWRASGCLTCLASGQGVCIGGRHGRAVRNPCSGFIRSNGRAGARLAGRQGVCVGGRDVCAARNRGAGHRAGACGRRHWAHADAARGVCAATQQAQCDSP